jgi:hypothetical protein
VLCLFGFGIGRLVVVPLLPGGARPWLVRDRRRELLPRVGGSRVAPSEKAQLPFSDRAHDRWSPLRHELVCQPRRVYGNAPSPYRRVYVIDGAAPHAADLPGGIGFRRVARPFGTEVKAEITRQLDGAPPLAFVRPRSQVIAGRSSGSPGEVIHGGVLVTLGPVTWINSGMARIGNNRWAAGKDGQWLV